MPARVLGSPSGAQPALPVERAALRQHAVGALLLASHRLEGGRRALQDHGIKKNKEHTNKTVLNFHFFRSRRRILKTRFLKVIVTVVFFVSVP